MNTTKETKRALKDIIDMDKYIIPKGVRKVYREKFVLYKDGRMKLNNTFIKATEERDFSIAFLPNFHEVIVVPDCEPAIHFSKNGDAKDVDIVKRFGKKSNIFPLEYELYWEDKNRLWRGQINKDTKQ